MVLTEAQLQEIAKRVRAIIRAESKGVGAVASARGPPTKPRSAGLSEVLKPQSKVHLERRFRSLG